MAVYGYCRVSTLAQADAGESLDVQRRQLEGWATMQGVTIDKVFVERGVSGSVAVSERPEGGAMLALLRRGDTIVVSKLDRLFRSALDALAMVERLKAQGVPLVLLDLGGDISGNGLSKLFLTIAAAFAEAERDRIRERISQVKADQKARGRYLGGKVPYGFRPGLDGTLEAVPEEQRVIARARELRAKGKPLRAIRDTLVAEMGVRLSLDTLARVTK
ncbi:MAG: recombinase family protein [Acidocella sp.]|nr:recombinase family protein [Acidocella sp.]